MRRKGREACPTAKEAKNDAAMPTTTTRQQEHHNATCQPTPYKIMSHVTSTLSTPIVSARTITLQARPAFSCPHPYPRSCSASDARTRARTCKRYLRRIANEASSARRSGSLLLLLLITSQSLAAIACAPPCASKARANGTRTLQHHDTLMISTPSPPRHSSSTHAPASQTAPSIRIHPIHIVVLHVAQPLNHALPTITFPANFPQFHRLQHHHNAHTSRAHNQLPRLHTCRRSPAAAARGFLEPEIPSRARP